MLFPATSNFQGPFVPVGVEADVPHPPVIAGATMKVAAGPVATVGLPFRLRPGLHGNWYTADQIGDA